MGKINKIFLKNFRNFKNCELSFNNKCNILFGNNGSGKTNILESISLLCKGRGFRNAKIKNLIHKNEKNFLIESIFSKDNNKYNIKVYPTFSENKYKKILSLNDEISKEANDFLENSLSNLLFLPEMERLFIASPNYRRNFVDKLIFSEKKITIVLLINIKKIYLREVKSCNHMSMMKIGLKLLKQT